MKENQLYFVRLLYCGEKITKFISAPENLSLYEIRNEIIRLYREEGKIVKVLTIDKESKFILNIDKSNFKKEYGRSHEECDDCKFENFDPMICPGHVAGESHCCYFWPKEELWDLDRG